MFSVDFLQVLIWLALCWTGAGALTLLTMVLVDWLRGKLW